MMLLNKILMNHYICIIHCVPSVEQWRKVKQADNRALKEKIQKAE